MDRIDHSSMLSAEVKRTGEVLGSVAHPACEQNVMAKEPQR